MKLITLGNLHLPFPSSLRERLSPLSAKRPAAFVQVSRTPDFAAASKFSSMRPQLLF